MYLPAVLVLSLILIDLTTVIGGAVEFSKEPKIKYQENWYHTNAEIKKNCKE